jgi:hypothetical protein
MTCPLLSIPFCRVGITAPRPYAGAPHGITDAQKDVLAAFLLSARARGITEFHHGDCRGGDQFAAGMARWLGFWLVGHVPTCPDYCDHLPCRNQFRAYVVNDENRPPKGYLARDRALVRELRTAGALIGLPASDHRTQRSGTWYTIDRARDANLPRLVVGPSGTVIDHVGIEALYPLPASGVHALDEVRAPVSTEFVLEAEGPT